MPAVPKIHPRSYPLAGKFGEIIAKVRMLAPPGLTEKWGVVNMVGVPDFRLNLGRYRVIGAIPTKAHVAVYMEWSKLYRNRSLYRDDPDFAVFEDAHAYLTKRVRYPWAVRAHTPLDEKYVDDFLDTGMRLMVKELKRIHPKLAD